MTNCICSKHQMAIFSPQFSCSYQKCFPCLEKSPGTKTLAFMFAQHHVNEPWHQETRLGHISLLSWRAPREVCCWLGPGTTGWRSLSCCVQGGQPQSCPWWSAPCACHCLEPSDASSSPPPLGWHDASTTRQNKGGQNKRRERKDRRMREEKDEGEEN